MKDIDDGIAAVEHAGYGAKAWPSNKPHVPFFRFPGFADSVFMLEALDRRPMAVFGTDLWAADWLRMTPDHERDYVIHQLEPRRATPASFSSMTRDDRRRDAARLPARVESPDATASSAYTPRPARPRRRFRWRRRHGSLRRTGSSRISGRQSCPARKHTLVDHPPPK